MTDYAYNAANNGHILMVAKSNCLRANSMQKLGIKNIFSKLLKV